MTPRNPGQGVSDRALGSPRADGPEWVDLNAEVVVVGGGPAGSALAAELARRGRDVLLVDRESFPREKPCGECLNPGGVAALARLGLIRAVQRTGPVELKGWTLVTPEGRRAWARFPVGVTGWGVNRGSMDEALLREARRRGVRIMEGVRVRKVEQQGGGRAPPRALGETSGGSQLRLTGSVLVGADGLRSIVAREVGALRRSPRLRKASLSWRVRGSGPPRDRGYLFLGSEVTIGLAPVPASDGGDSDHWNGTVVVRKGSVEGSLVEQARVLLEDGVGHLTGGWTQGPELCVGPWASGPFDWPVRKAVSGRILLVGDAAGYFDPLTGQGLYRALRGAELAAELIDRTLPSRPIRGDLVTLPSHHALEPTASFRAHHRNLAMAFGVGRGVQRIIEEVISRPRLREPALSILERWPGVGALVVRITGDFIRSKERDAYGG